MNPKNEHPKHRTVHLKWLHTSDIHGALFASRDSRGSSLSSFYAYSHELKQTWGERLILTDGGDCLQGNPLTYYYNYVDTRSPHLVAQAMNEIGYVAGLLGNHDIETGHAVYERWMNEVNFPVLGANVVDRKTGKPFQKPYTIVEAEGIRIAILGMVTPAIPSWLPESLWSGLEFRDILECVQEWIPYIREKEQPDLLVGLFHSGLEGGISLPEYSENVTALVAHELPDFDFILYGHDHKASIKRIASRQGKETLCLAPSSLAYSCGEVDIKLQITDGKVVKKHISGRITRLCHMHLPTSHLYEIGFLEEKKRVDEWLQQPLGTLQADLHERDAFFGPSLFIDFIHTMQLQITGADISFAAPVSFDSHILKGTLTVKDLFSLYKYENFLYTMWFTGQEIKDFLEMSYALWADEMHTPEDHCLLMDYILDNQSRLGLKNLAYNMEAAAGISYTIDITRPIGERVQISCLADGTPFRREQKYRVAINSYRAMGGGELITKGAGIAKSEIPNRIIASTQEDLRLSFMNYIKEHQTIDPQIISSWSFVPEEWTKEALSRDRKIIFGE